jgi:hypothetical protein
MKPKFKGCKKQWVEIMLKINDEIQCKNNGCVNRRRRREEFLVHSVTNSIAKSRTVSCVACEGPLLYYNRISAAAFRIKTAALITLDSTVIWILEPMGIAIIFCSYYLLAIIFCSYYLQGPPLWSSGRRSWLQIKRSWFDSRRYQIF